ncbi:MAG: sulfatase-like hydrolase/transferase [Planctomycetota bacterium]
MLITADHGEGLGEHGEMTHGYFLYGATTRVPLLLHGPGLPAGKVVAATVSHADVTPTILDLLGVADAMPRSGRSLVPLLRGEPDAGEIAYMESELPRINWGFHPMRALVQAGWRYIKGGETELYAPDDRAETMNVIDPNRDRAASLAQRLAEHEANGPASPATVPLDAQAQDALRALGYVGGNSNQAVSKRSYRNAELVEVIGTCAVGRSQMMTGRFDEAEANFRRLIELCPDAYSGYELLGTTLATRAQALPDGDPHRFELFLQARPQLERAIALQAGLRDAHFNLALVLHFLGDDGAAVKELDQVLKIDPNHALAKKLRAHP